MVDRSAAARKGWDTRRRRAAGAGDAPLRPGEESKEAGVVLVEPSVAPRKANEDGISLGSGMVAVGVTLDLRADVICDAVSTALLTHHRESIMSGRRPEGGAQRPLSKGRQAEPGRESTHRGYATGEAADGLRRTQITGNAAAARCKILPPTSRTVFFAREAERGVGYLAVDGVAGAVARAAAEATVELLTTGRRPPVDDTERTAVDAAKET